MLILLVISHLKITPDFHRLQGDRLHPGLVGGIGIKWGVIHPGRADCGCQYLWDSKIRHVGVEGLAQKIRYRQRRILV